MASLLSNEKYALYYQKVGLLYKRPEIRASLEVILSVFTVTILILVAIRPTLVNITSLQKKIEDQEVVSKKADNKISQLISAEKQLKEYAMSLSLYDTAVPDGYTYAGGAERLEYLAKSNNVNIESLTFSGYSLTNGQAVKQDWFNKVAKTDANNLIIDNVSFTVSGKPQNIINFLKQAENMDLLAVLSNVSITKQMGMTRAEDTLKATGQIRFYFYFVKP